MRFVHGRAVHVADGRTGRSLRQVVAMASLGAVPIPALAAALNHQTMLRTARLPTSLSSFSETTSEPTLRTHLRPETSILSGKVTATKSGDNTAYRRNLTGQKPVEGRRRRKNR